MYKTKKALSFFLAVCMFVISLSPVFAATNPINEDYSKATQVDAVTLENDASMLVLLGLLVGDQGGLRLSDGITRAEVATLVCRILGNDNLAQTSTVFGDVPSSHWASGYINYANQRGIIAGYGADANGVNNFGPEDAVTIEQTVKMVVAAMGYNPEAEAQGGYPGGYLSVASRLGITNGVTVKDFSAEALREAVVVVIAESLDKPLMVRKSYGSSEEYVQDETKSLFSEYLKTVKLSGTITDNEFGGQASGVVEFNVDDNFNTYWDTKYKEGEKIKLNVGTTDAANYLGKPVTILASHNSSSGNSTIVSVKANTGNTVKSALEDIEAKKDNANYNYAVDYQTYGGNSNVRTITFDANGATNTEVANVYINGVGGFKMSEILANTTSGGIKNLSNANGFTHLNGAYGTIEFFKSANAKNYDSAVVTAYVNLLVDRVDADSKIVYGKTGVEGPSLSEIDYSDADKVSLTIRDSVGNIVKPEDLKEYDVLTVVVSESSSKVSFSAEVARTTISGTVTEYDETENTVVIDSKTYNVPNNVDKSVAAKFDGITGTFYVDALGSVVSSSEEAKSTESYALIAEALKGGDSKVKLYTTSGSTVTKNLAETARFNGARISDKQTSETLAKLGVLVYFEQNSNGEVVRIFDAVSNDKVKAEGQSSVSDASQLTFKASGQIKKSGSSMWITGSANINENTVFFVNTQSVDTNNDSKADMLTSASDFEVYKAADFTNNDEITKFVAYNTDSKNVAAVVTIAAPKAGIATNKVQMIRTITNRVTNSEGGSVPRLNFFSGSALVAEDAGGNFWTWNSTGSKWETAADASFDQATSGIDQQTITSSVQPGTVVSYRESANGEASKVVRLVGYDSKTDTPVYDHTTYTQGGQFADISKLNTKSCWKPTDELFQLIKENASSKDKAAYYFGEVSKKDSDRITVRVIGYDGGKYTYNTDEEFNLSGVTVWACDPTKTASNQVVKSTGASKIEVRGTIPNGTDTGVGAGGNLADSPQRVLVVVIDGKVSEAFTWIEK